MSLIKKIIYLILYGIVLAMIPASLNYIYIKFGVPKHLSGPLFITLLLLSGLVLKWQKLPKSNLIILTVFISCSIAYSAIVAIDHYMVDFFEPNMYWYAVSYIPLIVVGFKLAKKDE
jgi:hypothetical protein